MILVLLVSAPALASDYTTVVSSFEQQRRSASADERREVVEQGFDELTRFWLGTKWGLGLPQSDTPQVGKINCGTFVGTVLDHLGFEVNVKKLQRQPSELIIKTFTPPAKIMRFRNRPMDEFLAKVKSAGDGVYIIGLDFHVGFLRVHDGDVRFVHASYVTHTVVDEPASTAEPIVSSRYRVVGKIFGDRMLDAWSSTRRIPVKGNW